MSKGAEYRRLVGSTRWARLALEVKTSAMWQCEKCGIVTNRLAVHHIRPVEMGRTIEDMEARCFDRNNLMVLCYDCHSKEHARSRSAEHHQKTEELRVKRWHEKDIHIDESMPKI